MASKVFLHIGLPKTGTTFVQSMLWAHRDRLRSQDVLLPGRERRDHLWASRFWREHPGTPSDIGEWRAAWDLKVYGSINLSREVYRGMRERRAFHFARRRHAFHMRARRRHDRRRSEHEIHRRAARFSAR